MQVLEQKLSILAQGPGRTRRNPALDVLTGRVADERLQSLQSTLLSVRPTAVPTSEDRTAGGPSAMVLPVAAIRMAAVARTTRPAPSPWLRATDGERPRLRLVPPPPSRWERIPLFGTWLSRLFAQRQLYRWSAA
jgi:hypothetical protein